MSQRKGDGNRAPSPTVGDSAGAAVTAFYPPNLARASGNQLATFGTPVQGAPGPGTPGQYRPIRPPTPPPARPPGGPPSADRTRNQIVPRPGSQPPLPYHAQQRPPIPQPNFAAATHQGSFGSRQGTPLLLASPPAPSDPPPPVSPRRQDGSPFARKKVSSVRIRARSRVILHGNK